MGLILIAIDAAMGSRRAYADVEPGNLPPFTFKSLELR